VLVQNCVASLIPKEKIGGNCKKVEKVSADTEGSESRTLVCAGS
jgi:hypothetical protein